MDFSGLTTAELLEASEEGRIVMWCKFISGFLFLMPPLLDLSHENIENYGNPKMNNSSHYNLYYYACKLFLRGR